MRDNISMETGYIEYLKKKQAKTMMEKFRLFCRIFELSQSVVNIFNMHFDNQIMITYFKLLND